MMISEATALLIEDIKAGLLAIPQYVNAEGRINVAVRPGVKTDSQEGTKEVNQEAALFRANIFVVDFRRGKTVAAPNGLYSVKHELLVMIHTDGNGKGKAHDADTLLDVVNSVIWNTGRWILGDDMVSVVKKDEKSMLGYVASVRVQDSSNGIPYRGEMPQLPTVPE